MDWIDTASSALEMALSKYLVSTLLESFLYFIEAEDNEGLGAEVVPYCAFTDFCKSGYVTTLNFAPDFSLNSISESLANEDSEDVVLFSAQTDVDVSSKFFT